VGDVSVVDVVGRITLGEGSVALREVLRDLVRKGQKNILLNLGGASYIDSTGIGEIFTGFNAVDNNDGQLKLLNLTKRVKDLLQITKLYSLFDVFDDEATAVCSFSVAPTTKPEKAVTEPAPSFCPTCGQEIRR
jgi:anti-sigma B factor antagonist